MSDGAFHHHSNSDNNGSQCGINGLRLGENTPQEHEDSSNVLFVLREEVKTSRGKRREWNESILNGLSMNELTLV